MSRKNQLMDYIKQGFITFFLSLITLGPLAAWQLQGYEVSGSLLRAFRLSLALAVFRVIQMGINSRKQAAKKEVKGIDLSSNNGSRSLSGIFQWENHSQGTKLFLSAVLLVAALAPMFGGNYALTVGITAFIYVLLGLGLNIVVGLAGLLDLGFVAFYAVGAYSYALGAEHWGMGFWAAIPFAAGLAALLGCLLAFPVLRMHGDYLAIVTLGFGEIIRLILNNWLEFTGGPNGIKAPYPSLFGLEFTRSARIEGGTTFHEFLGIEYSSDYRYMFIYATLLLVVACTIFAVSKLKNMSIGRAWEALREDEIACRSLGINHVTVKLSAFAMGASIAGVAGVFFASYQGFINPTSFSFFESALILAIVVLGGLGSIPGVIMAAIVLTVLPELLRQFAEYRILIFGISMVGMMIWKPRGMMANVRARLKVKPTQQSAKT
ncbi:MAG: high-affinity branched-chain amino acid ABC transporter permease LivM [Pseudomonadota bacterium]